MWKTAGTVLALLLTAALIWLFPRMGQRGSEHEEKQRLTRVWCTKEEAARWIRGLSAGYEKRTGKRLYLRLVSPGEIEAAGEMGAPLPDVLVFPGGERLIAYRGYGLIVRREGAVQPTPAPTSALFFHPTPSPRERPEVTPGIAWEEVGAVLAPREMQGAVPGTVESANPVRDWQEGRAKAALATAEQAAGLQGYALYPVPEGRGLAPIRARRFTQAGEEFLSFLLEEEAQRALKAAGLYALSLRLYGMEDPFRFVVDLNR